MFPMDPELLEEDLEEIRADLKKIREIAQHDHQMLGVLYRYHRWTRAYVLLKILVIAGIIFGAYYYVEPFLEPAVQFYQKFNSNPVIDSVINSRSATSSSGFSDILKKI
jgi:hypothetical protein